MDISYKWLKEYTPLKADPKTFMHEMCMTGTEVKGYRCPADEIKNVVVGKILSINSHPNADKLLVCKVDIGEEEPVQIITGAHNIAEGDLVPVAKDGSSLPGGKKINKAAGGRDRGTPQGDGRC
jgi:phenylalanyl-tRNA synthetase beta chain